VVNNIKSASGSPKKMKTTNPTILNQYFKFGDSQENFNPDVDDDCQYDKRNCDEDVDATFSNRSLIRPVRCMKKGAVTIATPDEKSIYSSRIGNNKNIVNGGNSHRFSRSV
jgi:hypothetical protein